MKRFLAVILLPLSFILSLFAKPVQPGDIPEIINEEVPIMSDYQTADKIEGNNSLFYIVRPVPEKLNIVYSSDFGMSPELTDNTDSFNSAISYCREHSGTNLIIEPGKYRFSVSDKISLSNLDTCLISGENAEFIFSSPGTFFNIFDCNCLEVRDVAVDIDRAVNPLDDVVRVRNADKNKHTVDFCFFEKTDIDESLVFKAITQCDPESLTFGAKNSAKENYIYMNPEVVVKKEKIAGNVIRVTHNGAFDNFSDGDTFIIRYHVYDGQAFSINSSHNVTFNGIKLYGSYGSGFGGGNLAGHYQIINSYIGVDPQDKTGAHVSLGADAIHICNTSGFFNLENCDISGQGDDSLNIHDGLGYIYSVEGSTIRMYSSQGRINVGEFLAFKDTEFNEMNYSAAILSSERGEGNSVTVTFDKDVSDVVSPGCIAYNTCTDSGNYVIRNNYFHENRARALLLQSDNGICENNRFYKIQGQAIKIVMDIRPSLWQEGTGVNNLIIRNNVFDSCDYSGWGEQITVDTYIDGHTAECFAFKNITVSNNEFKNFNKYVINVMNVNGLDFTGNVIDASDINNCIYIQDYCENIKLDNRFTGKFAGIASVVKTKSACDFIRYNSLIK